MLINKNLLFQKIVYIFFFVTLLINLTISDLTTSNINDENLLQLFQYTKTIIDSNLLKFNALLFSIQILTFLTKFKFSQAIKYHISPKSVLVSFFPSLSMIYLQYKINSVACLENINKIDQFTKLIKCEVSEYLYYFQIIIFLIYFFLINPKLFSYKSEKLNYIIYYFYFLFIIYNLFFDSRFYENVAVPYNNLFDFLSILILFIIVLQNKFIRNYKYLNLFFFFLISYFLIESKTLFISFCILQTLYNYKNYSRLLKINENFLVLYFIVKHFSLSLLFYGGTDQLDFLNEILSIGNINLYFEKYLALYSLITPFLASKIISNFSNVDLGFAFIMSALNLLILIIYYYKLNILKLKFSFISFFGFVSFGIVVSYEPNIATESYFNPSYFYTSSLSFYQTYPTRYLLFAIFSLAYLLHLSKKVKYRTVYFLSLTICLDNLFIGLCTIFALFISELVFSGFFNFKNLNNFKKNLLNSRRTLIKVLPVFGIIYFQYINGYLSHFFGGYAEVLYLSHSYKGFHFIILTYLVFLIIYIFKRIENNSEFKNKTLTQFTFFYSVFIFLSYFYFLNRSFPSNLYFLIFNFSFLLVLSFHLLNKDSLIIFSFFPLLIFSNGISEIENLPSIDYSKFTLENVAEINSEYSYTSVDDLGELDLENQPSLMLNKYGSIFAVKNNINTWFTPYINPKIYNNYQCEFIFELIKNTKFKVIYLDNVFEDFNESLCREDIKILVENYYFLSFQLDNTNIYMLK